MDLQKKRKSRGGTRTGKLRFASRTHGLAAKRD